MMKDQVKVVELTLAQKNKWDDTVAMFTWACPGFRYLLYTLLVNNDGDNIAVFTEDVPMAATDGQNVMLNPETFLNLSLPERAFVLAHEVVHNVYNDPALTYRLSKAGELVYPDGHKIPFDNEQFQHAMDYRINAALVNSRIGKMPEGEWAGYFDPAIASANDGVYDIYRKIYEDNPGGSGPGGGAGKGGFDVVMQPGSSNGKDPGSNPGGQDPQKWTNAMAVAQSLESMKTTGTVSADLQRMFDMFLKPQVPWTEHIQGFFARRLGSGSYSWRRPDRRLIIQDIYAPGRSGFGVNWVCVWGDTSGSISAAELNTYFTELAGLIEDLRPRRVTVFWCDAKIKQTDDIYDASELAEVKRRGVIGGGGTDCRPVFKKIDEMGYEPPDALVCLTDGHASFPDTAPVYPVVWAMTTDVNAPFGEHVRIKAGA